MNMLEKDLEEIIFNTDRETLKDKGLSIEGKMYRQLNIGGYGVADLVTVLKQKPKLDRPYFEITVYELKKDKIGIAAFLQAVRYVKGIQRFLHKRDFSCPVYYNIHLIGSKIDQSGSFCYLNDLISSYCGTFEESEVIANLWMQTYKYDIDGVSFDTPPEFHASNEGF